jgi:hypothetical protein
MLVKPIQIASKFTQIQGTIYKNKKITFTVMSVARGTWGGTGDRPEPGAAPTGDGVGQAGDGGRRRIDEAETGTEDVGRAEASSKSSTHGRWRARGHRQCVGWWCMVRSGCIEGGGSGIAEDSGGGSKSMKMF